MVYLDSAATAPYVKYPSSAYGPFLNPNANYAHKEKRLLEQAEDRVKKAIGAKSGKVVFGGTSSQLIENLTYALDKLAHTNIKKDYQFLWSPYEHDSLERFNDCNDFYVSSLTDICMKAEDCRVDSVKPIVCWMGCNNITGELFPIVDIGKTCMNNDAFYICDATALVGHAGIPKNIDEWCSAFVMDGHKLGTELGIGAMWISDNLDRWLDGFKLHGTPNLAGALAMTQAVEDACDKEAIEKRNEHWFYLFKGFGLSLLDNGIRWVGVDHREWENGTWAINAIRLPGFNADALQQYLASKQIYVSIGGSACAEAHDFRVLNAYQLSNDEASEVIRISFNEDNTKDDIKALVEAIKEFKNVYC